MFEKIFRLQIAMRRDVCGKRRKITVLNNQLRFLKPYRAYTIPDGENPVSFPAPGKKKAPRLRSPVCHWFSGLLLQFCPLPFCNISLAIEFQVKSLVGFFQYHFIAGTLQVCDFDNFDHYRIGEMGAE